MTVQRSSLPEVRVLEFGIRLQHSELLGIPTPEDPSRAIRGPGTSRWRAVVTAQDGLVLQRLASGRAGEPCWRDESSDTALRALMLRVSSLLLAGAALGCQTRMIEDGVAVVHLGEFGIQGET